MKLVENNKDKGVIVMALDWKALKAVKKETTPFFSLILGPSGAGKSTLIGTLRKPTLYLYTSVENHGPVAAGAINKDIIPLCLDRSDKGELLTADQTFERTLDVLSDKSIANNVSAIAVDGATELDQIIRKTKTFSKYCMTDKGNHNTYKEGEAVIYHLKQIVEALKGLHALGTHSFMTCAAMIKTVDETGGITECTPKLLGFDTANDLIRQFSDVLLVSRVMIPTEDNPEPHPVHALMFHGQITKTSRDMKGQVLKTANFSPRISGMLVDELPALMEADLSTLLKFKDKK